MSTNTDQTKINNLKIFFSWLSVLGFFVFMFFAYKYSGEFESAIIFLIAGIALANYGISIYPKQTKLFVILAFLYQAIAIALPIIFYVIPKL